VIFLDMPPSFSRELMKERANKFTGEQKKIYMREMTSIWWNHTGILCMLPKNTIGLKSNV